MNVIIDIAWPTGWQNGGAVAPEDLSHVIIERKLAAAPPNAWNAFPQIDYSADRRDYKIADVTAGTWQYRALFYGKNEGEVSTDYRTTEIKVERGGLVGGSITARLEQ